MTLDGLRTGTPSVLSARVGARPSEMTLVAGAIIGLGGSSSYCASGTGRHSPVCHVAWHMTTSSLMSGFPK
eukprot:4596628-Prymnesium_polylepis.2